MYVSILYYIKRRLNQNDIIILLLKRPDGNQLQQVSIHGINKTIWKFASAGFHLVYAIDVSCGFYIDLNDEIKNITVCPGSP